MEYKAQRQSTFKVKPRLIIHGGAGNIQRRNYTPDKLQAYRTALIDVVSLFPST